MPKQSLAFRVGGERIEFAKLSSTADGSRYMSWPTRTGAHLSSHPSGKKHVRDAFGYYAPLLEPPSFTSADGLGALQYEPRPSDILLNYETEPLDTAAFVREDARGIDIDLLALLKASLSRPVLRIKGTDLRAYLSLSQRDSFSSQEITRNLHVAGRRDGSQWVLVQIPSDGDVIAWLEATPLAPILEPVLGVLRHAVAISAAEKCEPSPPLGFSPAIEASLEEEVGRLAKAMTIKDFHPPGTAP